MSFDRNVIVGPTLQEPSDFLSISNPFRRKTCTSSPKGDGFGIQISDDHKLFPLVSGKRWQQGGSVHLLFSTRMKLGSLHLTKNGVVIEFLLTSLYGIFRELPPAEPKKRKNLKKNISFLEFLSFF